MGDVETALREGMYTCRRVIVLGETGAECEIPIGVRRRKDTWSDALRRLRRDSISIAIPIFKVQGSLREGDTVVTRGEGQERKLHQRANAALWGLAYHEVVEARNPWSPP